MKIQQKALCVCILINECIEEGSWCLYTNKSWSVDMQNPMWLRKLCTTKSAQLLISQLPPKEAELPGQDVSVSASFPSISQQWYVISSMMWLKGRINAPQRLPIFPFLLRSPSLSHAVEVVAGIGWDRTKWKLSILAFWLQITSASPSELRGLLMICRQTSGGGTR